MPGGAYIGRMFEILLESPASLALLIATVVVTLYAFTNQAFWHALALEPYRMVREHQYFQVITSGFLHGGMSHLALNMLTLFFFGPYLELLIVDATGSRAGFLLIYFISMIVGSLYPLIKYRNRQDYAAIGASGAISGILFAFCLARPTATIYVFGAIPMYSWIYAILFTAYSMYAMRKVDDNIGHEAHLAGAIAGMVTTIIVAPEIVEIFHLVGIGFP